MRGPAPQRLVFEQGYSQDSPLGSEQTYLLRLALLLVESREQDWSLSPSLENWQKTNWDLASVASLLGQREWALVRQSKLEALKKLCPSHRDSVQWRSACSRWFLTIQNLDFSSEGIRGLQPTPGPAKSK